MKYLRILFVAMVSCFAVQANAQCIGEEDAKKIEFAVEQISRICPTSIWDGWTFQQIVYDREMNALCLVIQPSGWRSMGEDVTQEEMEARSRWVVENLKSGYEDAVANKRCDGDGDFMLYLSLGTLLHNLAQTDTKLVVALLKPFPECLLYSKKPVVVESKEIERMFGKE